LAIALENEFAAPNGENITYDATAFESYWQLTPTGKYWGDLACSRGRLPIHRGDAKSYTFGPLAQTEFGEIAGFGALQTLNLLFTKTVGNNSTDTTRLNVAWQSRLLVNPVIAPGFEYYSQIDQVLNPGNPPSNSTGSGRYSLASRVCPMGSSNTRSVTNSADRLQPRAAPCAGASNTRSRSSRPPRNYSAASAFSSGSGSVRSRDARRRRRGHLRGRRI